jgi:hypothetical protein
VLEVWIALVLLGADLLGAAAKAAGHWWGASPVGSASTPTGLPSRDPDLTVLGLDRMPPSRDELRRAYRAAAKAAHPDAGGSAEAFRAVSEAFEKLARRLDPRAA